MLAPEISAHQSEAIMSKEKFRELFDSYDGLTPAQRLFGDRGCNAVYFCTTPIERNMTYYDTTERSGFIAKYDFTESDWYPEFDFALTDEEISKSTQLSVNIGSLAVCLNRAA
jgi:hypothetical protein